MKKSLAVYVILLAVLIAALFGVLRAGVVAGSALAIGAPGQSSAATLLAALHAPVSQLLLQVLVIVIAARLAGALFTKLGQPAVVGEMAVGIALGPSVLGSLLPAVATFVFPPESGGLANLSMLSQVGVLLFMFLVGMDLDSGYLRKRAQAAILISHASIVVPFLLGILAAFALYQGYAGEHASFVAFALFLGISMSITAFPVLARILQERGLTGTQLGSIAITCAAVDDITAWTALAFIVALSKAQSLAGAGLTLCLSATFIVLMLTVAKPLLRRWLDRLTEASPPGKNAAVVALVTVFASALLTETIGIHAIFGAFFAGVVMPKSEMFRRFLRERLEYFTTLFLLPVFFAITGLRTQVGLLAGATDWLVCLLLLVIAVAGKFGGSTAAARFTGMSWRDSAAIGVLMNTRGLMELIALNLGLDLGVLSPKVFAMLVLMALITTFSTGPLLQALGVGGLVAEERTPPKQEAARA